jgi:osmotically-inducible protein OsmY
MMKWIKTLGCATLTLSVLASLAGCPLLLIGAAGGGALAVTDRRTLPTQAEDRRIQMTAHTRFIRELPDEAHVNITVFNRRVLLTGEVPGEAEKRSAESMAREIANVRGIVNELAIRGASSMGARSRDAYLTTCVKAALVATKRLSANHLKVVTERGIVYLMGLVTTDEGKRAADTASRMPSVQKVVTVYEYIQPPAKKSSFLGTSSQEESVRRTSEAPSEPSAATVRAVPDTSATVQSLERQSPAPISNASEVRPVNPNRKNEESLHP